MGSADNDLESLENILDSMSQKNILVIGDIMLDRFIYGEIHRISPESAAPVLAITRETSMPGGAGNVAVNLKTLGLNPHLLAVTGADETGAALTKLLQEQEIVTEGLVNCAGRPTTVKTRYVAAAGQLLRADCEVTDGLDAKTCAQLLDKAAALMPEMQAVILSDYNKGVLAGDFIQQLIALAKAENVMVLVDPKKRDYSLYQGADIITPNRKELADITGLPATTDAEIATAAAQLMQDSGIEQLVITRSEDGMAVFTAGAAPVYVRETAAQAYDVSGAGDTAISCLAAALAAGADLADAARLANQAGSVVVAKAGTAAVTAKELQQALGGMKMKAALPADQTQIAPLYDDEQAAACVKQWQQAGLKVGFTNGCFDILHYGHVNYLSRARQKCDRLVVGLNHDRSIKILKGPERPLHDEQSRAAVIGALGAVDMVVLFGAEKEDEDNTPCALIKTLQPDIYFKGGDYTLEQLPEAKIVQDYGGAVEIMSLYEGHSTTATVRKIKDSEAA